MVLQQLISSILHSKSAIHTLPPGLEALAIKAYARSLSTVWFTASAIAVLTIISSLFIQEKEVGGAKKDKAVEHERERTQEEQ